MQTRGAVLLVSGFAPARPAGFGYRRRSPHGGGRELPEAATRWCQEETPKSKTGRLIEDPENTQDTQNTSEVKLCSDNYD